MDYPVSASINPIQEWGWMEASMLNFKGVTHISENPKGHAEGYNFSLSGSVPATMMEPRKPTNV